MEVIRNAENVRNLVRTLRARGKKIGLVPTMGALHRGHLSLVNLAKKHADVVLVSIFVNPLQFAPHEDFDSYPRTEQEDLELCESSGVDLVFIPQKGEINSKANSVQINVGEIGNILDGVTRPHFFHGVASVVAKLFNITEPDIAIFGQKDYQQAMIIRKLVVDLNFGTEILVGPIIREANGLAMSSRNRYLSADDKEDAGVIFTALQKGAEAIGHGIQDRKIINAVLIKHIREFSNLKIDYIQAVAAEDLSSPDEFFPGEKVAMLIAVYSGATRLIDNSVVIVPTHGKNSDVGSDFIDLSESIGS